MAEVTAGAARDDGSADPRLAAAVRVRDLAGVYASLGPARVFVALRATATGEHLAEGGVRVESGAELALLWIEHQDGARALPVFLDVASLRRWRLEARPVPLTGRQACDTVLAEQGRGVVVDPGGAAIGIELPELAGLAEGWVPIAGSSLDSRVAQVELGDPSEPVDPRLVLALREALRGERLRSVRLLGSEDGLVVGVAARRGLDAAQLAALAQRVRSRIGSALPAGGLALTQVPVHGPGLVVITPGRPWVRWW